MSFIGDLLRAGIESDGSKVEIQNRLCLAHNTKTGAGSSVELGEETPLSILVTNATGGAFSLEDGKYVGQVKIAVVKTHDTNDAVITPDSFGGGTTVTLSAAGEGAIFVWDGSNWQLAGAFGEAVA